MTHKHSTFRAAPALRDGRLCSSALTLSEYERLALDNRLNLSDGHARQSLSSEQRAIVAQSLSLLDTAIHSRQRDVESEFTDVFFSCAGQRPAAAGATAFLSFSSSTSIKLTAQFCRARELVVHLIEPCFDNIVHLLRREGVLTQPVLEREFLEPSSLAGRLDDKSVLWLVMPNNPTGFCLSKNQFADVLAMAAERSAMVVVDFCFRFYAADLASWDQYALLRAANLNFIGIEDTGKTWSLADTKAGIAVCSPDTAPLIYHLHDELLLNVSPLHLLLLTQLVRDSVIRNLDETVRNGVRANRVTVHTLVDDGLVEHATQSCKNVPMELLRLPGGHSAAGFWQRLRELGVDILPASNYYWSRPDLGRDLFRIPLARPSAEIERAVPIIAHCLRTGAQ